VYSISANVIGLKHSVTGLVVPVSLACQSPEILDQGTYNVLVGSGTLDWDTPTTLEEAEAAIIANNGETDEVRASLKTHHSLPFVLADLHLSLP
jgi:hypothetical protein